MKNNETIMWILIAIAVIVLFSGFGMMGFGGFGYGGMMYDFGFGWLFMLLILIALILFITWLIRELQKK